MADYDLQYQDSYIDTLLATANELKTAGYIYKGVATPSTNPGTPTERVAYLASEPGTYTNFGGIVITSGLYSLTYASGTWTGTQMQAGLDIEVVQTTGDSTTDVMSQKAVTDEIKKCALVKENESTADLDISDKNGYVLARFAEGHFQTKNFNSVDIEQLGVKEANTEFNIADGQGYVIIRVNDGNIFIKNFTNAPLRGKRVSFIGDSITTYEDFPGCYVPYYKASNMNITGMTSVDKTWWKALCDKQGAAVNRIYAYGGGDVATTLCLHYNELYSNGLTGTPPDYIFILAGINDYGHNIVMGTINDAEAANSTFYAGYKYLLGHLKTEYPNAKIFGLTILNSMYLGTTIPSLNSNGDSITDFCDAIKKCCDFYSIPYIDLNKLVNINGGNYTTYLADYTHPNAVGASLITNAIKNNIINLTNE